jgi:hypothetical protein
MQVAAVARDIARELMALGVLAAEVLESTVAVQVMQERQTPVEVGAAAVKEPLAAQAAPAS